VLVAVGGHTRNIGKTSVVSGLIRSLPQRNWTAIKITQFGHGVCSQVGHACGCETELDHPYALDEEFQPSDTDSGRFLRSGAKRSFWLRTATGQLGNAVPVIRKILAASPCTIVESNSILEFFDPDLYLVVLDFSNGDFKSSSLRYLDRADAFIVIDRGMNVPLWKDISRGLYEGKMQFVVKPPQYVTSAISSFVEDRLETVSSGTPA
jgi:hypothetical protein